MYNAFQLNFSPVPRSEAVGQGEICNSKIDHNSQESLSGSSFSTLLDQEEHVFVERSHPLVNIFSIHPMPSSVHERKKRVPLRFPFMYTDEGIGWMLKIFDKDIRSKTTNFNTEINKLRMLSRRMLFPSSSAVLSGLNDLRKSKTFCDVSLCVEGEEFPCHKAVLASFSPYFKAMFASEMAESLQNQIVLNGVEAPTLKLLLEYAYTAQVSITKSNVQALLSAANLLEVLPVRDACCRFMEKHMDETNCLGIHCFAETHACLELQQKSKEFALRYFAEVMHQEEILNLNRNKLIELISSDDLEVEKEEEVFEAVLLWLNYKPNERNEDFHKVLEQVRLPLLSPYYLHDYVATVPTISSSSQCQSLIEEATTYNLLPDRRHEKSFARTKPRKSVGVADVIVAVGGEDDKVVLRCVECFDPLRERWLSLACLPYAVSKHGVVVTGQNIMYMAGGEFPDGTASKSLWRYDPVFDVWQEMASMNVARSELGFAAMDGYLYAVGGWEGVSRLSSVERYDPLTNMWQFVASLKISLTSPATVAHRGHLYVTGGAVLEDGDGIDLVQRYNPRTNTWSDMAPMLIARSGSKACVVNDLIYVIGGWHASTENTNKVECYDPQKNEWQFKKSMREKRYQPGIAVVNGKVYVCGGEEGWDRYHDTLECYHPETDQWSVAGIMQTPRSWLCCATLRLPVDARTREERS